MPPSEKPKKPITGDAVSRTKVVPKGSERQTAKPTSQLEKKAETEEPAAGEAPERKTSAKLSPPKERKAAVQPLEPRERKLTPQQRVHLARARRRHRNQGLALGVLALLVIVVVAVVVQQVIAKNEANTQLANAHAAATATSGVVTATAGAKATATENAVAPDSPPAVTETPVTLKDGLQYIDTKVGSGPAAKTGDTVNVQYVGWNTPDNCKPLCKFDSSYDSNGGKPISVTLGAGQVIPGWDEGIVGMKAGGTRRLIIPPALAYGAQGQGPIPANATIIFDIQLVSIGTASG